MGRRRKCRCVGRIPKATFYKPHGVPLGELKGMVLTVEGAEALRLVDAEGFDQETAAASMNVSRPTLCRILAEARKTVATALSNGFAIRIEGGDYQLVGEDDGECAAPGFKRCGHGSGNGPGCGPRREQRRKS